MGNRPKVKKPKTTTSAKLQDVQIQLDTASTAAKRQKAVPKVDAKLKKKAAERLKEIQKKDVTPSIKPSNALAYLREWGKRESEDWKFKKTQHLWLVKNWKQEDFLGDEEFELFTGYMKGDSGQTKKTLLEDAQKVVDDEGVDDLKKKRARNLLQNL